MRRGQVAIYLLVTLVALTLLALLNVDVFNVVRCKMRVQNAGDAAALAAARYQGELLNEIGRLNLKHIEAAIKNDREECDAIVLKQRRLALLGPIEALREADLAARKNYQKPRAEFSRILMQHVQDVRMIYAGGNGASPEPYPESWNGAWMEYAMALEQVAGDGLAVGPDNIEFYNYNSGHPLMDRYFYHAIAGRNWCWFKFHWPDLLQNYDGYESWWPIPVTSERQSFVNSEVFSLHVHVVKCSIADAIGKEKILDFLESNSIKGPMGVPYSQAELALAAILTNREEEWFFYEPTHWRTWDEMNPLVPFDEYGAMPVIGEVKPHYNVRGAAAVVRCVGDVEATALEKSSRITWSAAAKPFGSIQIGDEELAVNSFFNFIIPAFTSTRLVPIDSVGGRDLATADYDWVSHLRGHILRYLEYGPMPSQCYYCSQLVSWENKGLRDTGARWLKFHGDSCRRPTGGGGGRGGTVHAH